MIVFWIFVAAAALIGMASWMRQARPTRIGGDPIYDQDVAFGARPLGPILAGKAWCDVDVVGEASYQAELQDIAGDDPDGADLHCWAVLHPEPDNPHDANAVAVKIGGRTVAYLDRAMARSYRTQAAALGLGADPVNCRAYVCGGWREPGRKRNHYGVKLGLRQPLSVEPPT